MSVIDQEIILTEEEKLHIRTVHNAVRKNLSRGERYRNIAWAWIRGFEYSRVEKNTRIDKGWKHRFVNQPNVHRLVLTIVDSYSDNGFGDNKESHQLITEWIVRGSPHIPWLLRQGFFLNE